jgi:hypothetical protein
MAYVDYALICNAARVDSDGLVSILGAGVDRLISSQLPSNVVLTFVARIVWGEEDLGARHEVQIRVRHEDDEELARFDAAPQPAREPGMADDLPVATVLALPVPLQIRRVGKYYFQLRIAGEVRAEPPLVVVIGPQL